MSQLELPINRPERRAQQRSVPLPEVKFVPAGNPSLPTFVSLMLMITTFMIVLTSISLHENTRMHQLLSGVQETFSATPVAMTPKSSSEILGAAAQGFQASLPMTKVTDASGGESLRLVIPIAVALDTTQKQVTAEMQNALGALVKGLSLLPKDTDYDVELRFADATLSAEYANMLAQAAMNQGLAHTRMMIGNVAPQEAEAIPNELSVLVELTLPASNFVTRPMPEDTRVK